MSRSSLPVATGHSSESESDTPSDSAYSRVSLHTLRLPRHGGPSPSDDTETDADADADTDPDWDADADGLSDAGAGMTRYGFTERTPGEGTVPRWQRTGRHPRLSGLFHRFLRFLEGPQPDVNDDPLDPNYKPVTAAERQRILLSAGIKLAVVFSICLIVLVLTLYLSLPRIEPDDKASFKIPRSFEDLKALNTLLQKYKQRHNARVLLSWVSLYLFLQTFSVPGSMYMSMLAGALWSTYAWPLVVCSIACGASLAYLISMPMGTLLDILPNWKRRVDSWKARINQEPNLISYLVVVRMAPVPPHSVINVLCPHLGIGLITFWISTALGIAAVSFIHVTIGQKLDEMVGPDEFQLVSLHNALILGGVILAALFPIAVRKFSSSPPLEEAPIREGQISLSQETDEGANTHTRPAQYNHQAQVSSNNEVGNGRLTTQSQNRPWSRKSLDVEDVSDDELPAVAPRTWSRSLVQGDHSTLPIPHHAQEGAPTFTPLETDADVAHNPFDSDSESEGPDALDGPLSVWGAEAPKVSRSAHP